MQTILNQMFDEYNQFTPNAKNLQEIEAAHQSLICSLEKPERKLILRIIDGKDLIAGVRARESFACGLPVVTGWRGGYSHNYTHTTAVAHLRKFSMWAAVFLCQKEVWKMNNKAKADQLYV